MIRKRGSVSRTPRSRFYSGFRDTSNQVNQNGEARTWRRSSSFEHRYQSSFSLSVDLFHGQVTDNALRAVLGTVGRKAYLSRLSKAVSQKCAVSDLPSRFIATSKTASMFDISRTVFALQHKMCSGMRLMNVEDS